MKNKTVILVLGALIFFSPNICRGQETNVPLIINGKGIPNIIEIGMSITDLEINGVGYKSKGKNPFTGNDYYIVEELNAEFEIEKSQIIRIFFFLDKYTNTSINCRLKNDIVPLSEITAELIISVLGDVKVFETEHPKDQEKIAYWDRYDPFNLKVSFLRYPNYPYRFTFSGDNRLYTLGIADLDMEGLK